MIFIFNIKTDSKVKIIVKFFSKKRKKKGKKKKVKILKKKKKKKGKKERERERKKVNSYRTFKEYL